MSSPIITKVSDVLAASPSLISQITVEELIQKHMLYLFYAGFLPQERSRPVPKTMKPKD